MHKIGIIILFKTFHGHGQDLWLLNNRVLQQCLIRIKEHTGFFNFMDCYYLFVSNRKGGKNQLSTKIITAPHYFFFCDVLRVCYLCTRAKDLLSSL